MLECMAKLASQHPRSQFLKMISTDCIPDLPDSKLPTVLVYHEKACKKTFAGPGLWGGKRATEECALPQTLTMYLTSAATRCVSVWHRRSGGLFQ